MDYRIYLVLVSGYVDSSAAFSCAAFTSDLFDFLVEPVIDRKFFAAFDWAETHIDDVTPDDARDEVRFAGVVHVFSAGAPGCAIDCPIRIESK